MVPIVDREGLIEALQKVTDEADVSYRDAELHIGSDSDRRRVRLPGWKDSLHAAAPGKGLTQILALVRDVDYMLDLGQNGTHE